MFPTKNMFIVLRYNPQQMSPTAATKEMILASVMEGGGRGNSDEFLYLAVDTPSDGRKDESGRMMGYIMASTKGRFKSLNLIRIQ